MKIDALEAIATEISERLGFSVAYWCSDDQEKNPENDHIFGVLKFEPIKLTALNQELILKGQSLYFKCGHSHHKITMEGTSVSFGDCLTVDLSDPKSIDQIVKFYTPVEQKPLFTETGPDGWSNDA